MAVDVSGALQSKGHLIVATGLAKVFEITTHLRGEAGKRQNTNRAAPPRQSYRAQHGLRHSHPGTGVLLMAMERAGRLAGCGAVVTGSGGGMGGTIALRLAEEGAMVALNDRRPGATDPWLERITALGGDAFSVTGNVTRRARRRRVDQRRDAEVAADRHPRQRRGRQPWPGRRPSLEDLRGRL